MHLVAWDDYAEGLLAAGERGTISFVGDEDFFAGEERVDFGDGEDDLISVAGGSDNVAGHGLAGHASAELPACFGEEIVEQDAFVGGGAAVGGEGGGAAGQLGQVVGSEDERSGDGTFDLEGCGLGGFLGSGNLGHGRVTDSGKEDQSGYE